MIEKLILQQVLKKGRTTSEFGVTAVGGAIAALITLFGLPDMSPETIHTVASNVAEGAGVVKSVAAGNGSIMDGLVRIVALIMGGQIMSNYIKSRGDTKSAQIFAALKAMKKQLDTEPEPGSEKKVEGPANEPSV